jgi:hypothetical protein
MPEQQAIIELTVVDGRREKFAGEYNVRLFDGNQNPRLDKTYSTPTRTLVVPYTGTLADKYRVVVTAHGWRDAGQIAIQVNPAEPARVGIMLVPKQHAFNFHRATWDALATEWPELRALLSAGAKDDDDARQRYDHLRETPTCQPRLACLLNIVTAMKALSLPEKTAFAYLRQVIWDDSLAQDRFFAWADPQLLPQLDQAAKQGLFKPELGCQFFHAGSTSSDKQVEFAEANVQVTFHDQDAPPPELAGSIKVEPDMDCYRDLAAHAVLEVLPNFIQKILGKKGLTDPVTVYAQRWIVGYCAGEPDFDPLYTIEPA